MEAILKKIAQQIKSIKNKIVLTTNLNWIANCLGILSLLGFTLVFFPAIANILNYKHNNNKAILRVANWGLIVGIFFGLSHGLLMTQIENIDFYDLKTYWSYAEGLLTFNLLTFCAFNFTKITLNLKRFIYFTYALLFLLGCHLWEPIMHLW